MRFNAPLDTIRVILETIIFYTTDDPTSMKALKEGGFLQCWSRELCGNGDNGNTAVMGTMLYILPQQWR